MCTKCQDRGYYHDNVGRYDFFCGCSFGKELERKIADEGEECPICHNTGIHDSLDEYIPGFTHMVCQCSHGKDFLILTREHPEECPICHGTGKYLLFEKEKEQFYGPSERDCPHLT